MAIIAFDSVSKAYQNKTVLHDFSLVVEPGQRVVILGPSGCGKTTVLRLLAGFIAPDTGTISIDGHQETGVKIAPELRSKELKLQTRWLDCRKRDSVNRERNLHVQRLRRLL